MIYDIDYKHTGENRGDLSHWMRAQYEDGTIVDIHVDEVLDAEMDLLAAEDSRRQGKIGRGGRLFPTEMNATTTPRLAAAKRDVDRIRDEYFLTFILATFPAVWTIITGSVGAGPLYTRHLPGRVFGGAAGVVGQRFDPRISGERAEAEMPKTAAARGAHVPEIIDGKLVVTVDGKAYPPTIFPQLYHGTSDTPPAVALASGLPVKGNDFDLKLHLMGNQNSGLRGATRMPSYPGDAMQGAAHVADEGGWVYKLRGVPGWDVEQIMSRHPETLYTSLVFQKVKYEVEIAIPARIPSQYIEAYGEVVVGASGNKYVKQWIPTLSFKGGK